MLEKVVKQKTPYIVVVRGLTIVLASATPHLKILQKSKPQFGWDIESTKYLGCGFANF